MSVDSFNGGGPKVVVVPGTSQQHRGNPFHVPFTYRFRDKQVTTYFCCDNVRAVDTRERLRARMAARPVPEQLMTAVEAHLRTILGL